MGFTTGFVGGLTATYTILYLSLHLHRANRQHQSLLVTQQRALLTSIYDPPNPSDLFDPPVYEVRKVGLAEELKDRWNRELEGVVRHVQTTDWEEVRLRWERRVANVWANVRNTDVAKEVEGRFQENVVGTGFASSSTSASTSTVNGIKSSAKDAVGGKRLLEVK